MDSDKFPLKIRVYMPLTTVQINTKASKSNEIIVMDLAGDHQHDHEPRGGAAGAPGGWGGGGCQGKHS